LRRGLRVRSGRHDGTDHQREGNNPHFRASPRG
jgi:hypothetical protein